jgi:hypothetical protein
MPCGPERGHGAGGDELSGTGWVVPCSAKPGVVAGWTRGVAGSELAERSLVPDDGAVLGEFKYADWLGQTKSGK